MATRSFVIAAAAALLAGAAVASPYPPPLVPAPPLAPPACPRPAPVRRVLRKAPRPACPMLETRARSAWRSPPRRPERLVERPAVRWARQEPAPQRRRGDDLAGWRATRAVYRAELERRGFAPPPFPAADRFERARLARNCEPCRAPPPPMRSRGSQGWRGPGPGGPGFPPPPPPRRPELYAGGEWRRDGGGQGAVRRAWIGDAAAFESSRFVERRFDDGARFAQWEPRSRWRENQGGGYEVSRFAGRDQNGFLTWAGKPR